MGRSAMASRIYQIAERLRADYEYDPTHLHRPHGGGNWHRTEKGWSTSKQDKGEISNHWSKEPEERWSIGDNGELHRQNSPTRETPRWGHGDSSWGKGDLHDGSLFVQRTREETSPEKLDEMSHDDRREVLREVIRNPNTSEKTLRQMGKDIPSTRDSVNEELENRLLDKAINGDYRRKRSIARDPKTPSRVLDRMGDDEDPLVRWQVALNGNTPDGTLERLSEDPDEMVRRHAIENRRRRKGE